MMKCLYEILVPVARNNGEVIHLIEHKAWDECVRRITGGVTVMPPSLNGEWVDSSGEVYHDRMIPVRVLATPDEMEEIAEMTMERFDQKSVIFYILSEQAFIRYAPAKAR